MNNLKTIQESANLLLGMIPTFPETTSYQSCCLDPKYQHFPQELARLNAQITDYLAQAPELGNIIQTQWSSWLEDFLPEHGTQPLAEWTEHLTQIRNFAEMLLEPMSSPWTPAIPKYLIATEPSEAETSEIDISPFLVDDSSQFLPSIPDSNTPGSVTKEAQPASSRKRKEPPPPTDSTIISQLPELFASNDPSKVLAYASAHRPLSELACQQILEFLIPYADVTHLSSFIQNHSCSQETMLMALSMSIAYPHAWEILSPTFLPSLNPSKYCYLCETALRAEKAPIIANLLATAMTRKCNNLPRRKLFNFLDKNAPDFLTREMQATLGKPKLDRRSLPERLVVHDTGNPEEQVSACQFQFFVDQSASTNGTHPKPKPSFFSNQLGRFA